MFNFFKKMLMASQIKFEEGKIILMNEPVLMVPSDTFIYTLRKSTNFEETSRILYYGSKKAMIEGFGIEIGRLYGLKKEKFRKTLTDICEMGGWGILKFVNVNWEKKESIIHATNSTVAEKYGKSNKPVDHILRGLIAGGGSVINDIDLDVIETKCKAMGNPYCEFIVKPSSIMKASKDPRVKWQL